ncbi:MAG: CinA family protein [Clostridia bacterium]|nr:CinA family protein [Clostridia bacterium]
MERGWHISFAESCTAGLASARLVNVPNASKVFDASVVTYANEAKVSYLGVSEETIVQYGVVSEQVAIEMAKGVAKANSAEVGIGISGIAGPGGGTESKPVGMVCFGFIIGEELFSSTCYFGPIGREKVRNHAVEYVFETLCQKLK